MSGFFGNFGNDPKIQRAALTSKYNAARLNLLLIVIFTVINLVTLVCGVGGFILFSASIPSFVVHLGMLLCGMYPEEYYKGIDKSLLFDKSTIALFIAIALLVTALYLICWLFSKKKGAKWLKFALALFSADTMALFLVGSQGNIIFDAVFHIWILLILYSGIKASNAIKALPKEEEMIEAEYEEIYAEEDEDYCEEQNLIEPAEETNIEE